MPTTPPETETAKPGAAHSIGPLFRELFPPLLISTAAAIWCRSATGPTLGLFLGGLLLVTFIAPPLALADPFGRSAIRAAGVLLGTAIIWALSISAADVNVWELCQCYLVLAAYLIALTGLVNLLASARIARPPAAGLTILLGLLWLTWPVWLSPWLTQSLADWLVPANPVFAINSVLKHLGAWDRAPIAYRSLTVLNQDIPYRLPGSIVPACFLHAMIGAGAMLLRRMCRAAIISPTFISPVAL